MDNDDEAFIVKTLDGNVRGLTMTEIWDAFLKREKERGSGRTWNLGDINRILTPMMLGKSVRFERNREKRGVVTRYYLGT